MSANQSKSRKLPGRNSNAVRSPRSVNLNPLRRALPKMQPRPNMVSRRARPSRTNVNSANQCVALERITTVTIPTSSQAGDLLFSMPNNPNSAPRASAIASQYDSWYGDASIEVETTGNAFSKNFVIIRHVPNGDSARLPTTSAEMLNFAEAYGRRAESVKLQLDSNRRAICAAPWKGVSYNPKKPLVDTDPSECNNGLFIIVSNGSPGSESVDITIRYRYKFHFFGPIYAGILPNLSSKIESSTGTTPALPFGTSRTVTGYGITSSDGSSVTVKPGSYFIMFHCATTGLTVGPTFTASAGSISDAYTNAFSTFAIRNCLFTTSVPATISVTGIAATTLTSSRMYLAPYKI